MSNRRKFYEESVKVLKSDAFNSASPEEQEEIRAILKDTYSKIKAREDANIEPTDEEIRAERGTLRNLYGDLEAGHMSLARGATSLAAWTADIAGAKETAGKLDAISAEIAKQMARTSPQASPENLLDFGSQALLQNLPTLAATGLVGRALTGSSMVGQMLANARTAAGIPAIGGAAPLSAGAAQGIATTAMYGIPAMRQANVEAVPGEIREGNAWQELAAAVPYAAVESYLGVSPAKFVDAFAGKTVGAGISKLFSQYGGKVAKFLETPLIQLSNKHGAFAAIGAGARWIASNIIGEASEEVVQGIMEIAQPIVAKEGLIPGIQKTIAELKKDSVVQNLMVQAYGGGIVGGILGGAGTIQQKIVALNEAQEEMERKNAAVAELQKLAKARANLEAQMKRLQTAGEKLATRVEEEPIMADLEAEQAAADKARAEEEAAIMADLEAEQAAKDEEKLNLAANLGPEKARLLTLRAKLFNGITNLQEAGPRAAKAKSMAEAKEIDYNRASAILQYAMNPVDEQSYNEAVAAFREFPQELQDMVMKDYEAATPEAGQRLAVIPGTWEAKKAAAKQEKAKAKSEKKAARKAKFEQQKAQAEQIAKQQAKQLPPDVTVEKVKPTGKAPVTLLPAAKKRGEPMVGAGADGAKIEKRLAPAPMNPQQKLDTAKDDNTRNAILTDYRKYLENNRAAYEEYKSKPEATAKIPAMQNVVKEYEAVRDAVAKYDQATIKQPAPVAEPKAAESIKQPAAPAYKVESYQGGFRVLDAQGKQYSWHTSKQAADSKAAGLNKSPLPLTKTPDTIQPMGDTKNGVGRTEKPTAPEATGESLNLDQVRKLAKTEKVFVRWSAGPKYDLQMTGSKDKVSGSIHAGLSAVAIDPEWSNGVLASRLKEYGFLRLNDEKIAPYFYTGEIVGKDSDGHPSIKIGRYVGTLSNDLIKDLDRGLAEKLILEENIQEDEERLRRITDPSAIRITKEAIAKTKEELGKLPSFNQPTGQTKPGKPIPSKTDKIEDFGEVLHGARKLYSQEFADRFSKAADLETEPLSKSWPEPDYQKLIDAGMYDSDVALLRALRDSLPTKPRSAWKVKRWLAEAKRYKTFAEKLISGELSRKDFGRESQGFNFSELSDIKDLALLYDMVGHATSLAGARIRQAAYFYENGVKLDKPKELYAVIMPAQNSWRGVDVGLGKTKAEAIEDFKKKLPEYLAKKGESVKKRAPQFLVYQKSRGEDKGTYFIAYKTGGKLVELKSGFQTGKDAIDYRNNNRSELEAILENKREVKPERRLTNQPRIGKARRTGDVTPQQFSEAFGFRGVQFGNWVEGDRRQVDLNEAYDALMDLADVLGIPPKALSLNGELGLAFGSRGRGGKNPALAHYESNNVVINLTKKRGAGSLAHEWWHALDNYFGKAGRFASDSAADFHRSQTLGARQEIKDSFHTLMKTIHNATDMKKRGDARDKARSKPYWGTDIEISARSFESFILSKLSDAGVNNDYLANIVSEEAYQNDEENDYPYLLKSEIPSVKDAFTSLFQRMETEKTDKGVKLYSVEYVVAKYAARGLKQAAKVVRAGFNYMRTGLTRFTDWAKEMLKQLGKSIGPKLRAMFTDLTAVLKSRTGAISGRPAGSVPKSFGIQSKELQWIKDNNDLLRLTRNGKTLATLERRKPGGWRWAEANKAWARNELAIAKATVKSTIYEELKRSERETAKYQKAQEKAQKEAEAKKHKHDDYFNQPLSSRVSAEEKPLSWKDQVNNFVTKVHDAMYDRWAKGKRLIEAAVTEKNLKEIPESENFYQYLEILANRTANRTEMFKDENFKPIIDYLNKNKISYKEFNRFLRVMHAEERNEHIFNINPQFRQRAIEEPDNPMYAGSGITTKEARAEIEKMLADGTFDKFFEAGAMYWDLNNKLLDLQVKYGLMPADVRDAIKSKYTFYAPLKSVTDDATGLDWRALGRRSESSDQLAHTEKAIDATFSYGENARMRRAFAKFAINNPNPALYEMHRAVKKPYFDENTGEVKYRLDAYADRENMVYVPTSTGAIILTVKDPDLLRILKNQNDAEVGALLPYLRIVNRAAAAMHTAYSPEFLINNLIVDAQGAGIALSAEQSSEMAANVILGLPSAAIVAGKYKAGVKNEDTALFREFIEQGGKTGFRDVHKLADAAKLLEKRMMEAQKGGIVYQTKEMVKDIGSLVSDINDVVEAATRFSTYREAKKAGLSKGKAAALAANVTINFQKRGTWGQIINTLYLFGTANLGGQLKLATVMASASRTKMGRAAIAGGIALGFMLDLFNRMISDFDPEEERLYWDNLSSFEKDSNYIVMMPGGKDGYVKLPMPRGFNFLPAIGRNLAAMMFGQQTLGKTAQNVASAFINTASPIGADERGLSATLTPFAFKLPYDLITNTNWMGKRIRPAQPPFASPKPASELFNPNTNKVLVEITRALNSIAGGDKRLPSTRFTDLSPADVQYVIEYLTGGAGKFIGRSIDAAWRLGAGEPIRASDVPFARRVIGSGRDYSVFDRFAENRTWVKRFAEAKAEKDTAWMQKYSWLGLTTDLFKATDKKLNEIAGNETLTQDQKREAAILEQKRFNREFEQIKKQYEGKNVPIVESSGRPERRTRRRPTRRPSRR